MIGAVVVHGAWLVSYMAAGALVWVAAAAWLRLRGVCAVLLARCVLCLCGCFGLVAVCVRCHSLLRFCPSGGSARSARRRFSSCRASCFLNVEKDKCDTTELV